MCHQYINLMSFKERRKLWDYLVMVHDMVHDSVDLRSGSDFYKIYQYFLWL